MTATYATQAELLSFLGFSDSDKPDYLTDTVLQDALNRSQNEIDEETNTHFSDGTEATPDYTQVTNEKHKGKGQYNRDYFLEQLPLPNVSSEVSGTAITADDTTIWVTSTNGFPTIGTIGIESDKIAYTGKTTTAFTGCTGVDSAHGTAQPVKPYVVEISSTISGNVPVWTVLDEDREFDMDIDSARVFVYRDDFILDTYSGYNVRKIPNRFRATYLTGHSNIPLDIKRLCLMIAAKELMHTAVRKATMLGQNEFNPSMINVDDDWILDTIKDYKSYQVSNNI